MFLELYDTVNQKVKISYRNSSIKVCAIEIQIKSKKVKKKKEMQIYAK